MPAPNTAVAEILAAASRRALSFEEIALLKDALNMKSVLCTVSTSLYPLEAIHRAIYWLSEEIALSLVANNEGEVAITANTEALSDADIVRLRERLTIALNDFTLRIKIEEKTAPVREKLIQSALCGAIGKAP